MVKGNCYYQPVVDVIKVAMVMEIYILCHMALLTLSAVVKRAYNIDPLALGNLWLQLSFSPLFFKRSMNHFLFNCSHGRGYNGGRSSSLSFNMPHGKAVPLFRGLVTFA